MNALSEALARRRAAGKPILDLTVSNPTEVGLEYPAHHLKDFTTAENFFPYQPHPMGEWQAREAVAAYLRNQGQKASAKTLGLTSGTSEAYSFLFRILAKPGDEIMTLTPGYPLCDALIEWAGLKQVTFAAACRREANQLTWHIDWDRLEQNLSTQTRALIFIHPNNPTGWYWTADDWQQALRIASDHHLALIVDTVFFDYAHPGMPQPAPWPVPVPDSTGPLLITLGGLSKTCALPQIKLAWASFDGDAVAVAKALEQWEWMADLFLSVSTPAQRLAPTLLQACRDFQTPLHQRLQTNRLAAQGLDSSNAILPHWPQGGWYLPLQIKGCENDEEGCIDLLENFGVLTQPGYFFDYAQEGMLVTSLITPPSTYAQGLAAIQKWAATISTK